jgi:hypothetical protein
MAKFVHTVGRNMFWIHCVYCTVLCTEQSFSQSLKHTVLYHTNLQEQRGKRTTQHNTTQHNTTTTQARNQESKRQYINWLSPPLEYKGIGKTERRN